jgi:hypothetical protein
MPSLLGLPAPTMTDPRGGEGFRVPLIENLGLPLDITTSASRRHSLGHPGMHRPNVVGRDRAMADGWGQPALRSRKTFDNSVAGPHWVREVLRRCASLKHNGAEFIFYFKSFDGGRTRARTLDPLIKSQWHSRKIRSALCSCVGAGVAKAALGNTRRRSFVSDCNAATTRRPKEFVATA